MGQFYYSQFRYIFYHILQIKFDKHDNKIRFIILWLPQMIYIFPLKNLEQKVIALKISPKEYISERLYFRKSFLANRKYINVFSSYVKKNWLVLRSCWMLWSSLVLRMRPQLALLAMGGYKYLSCWWNCNKWLLITNSCAIKTQDTIPDSMKQYHSFSCQRGFHGILSYTFNTSL